MIPLLAAGPWLHGLVQERRCRITNGRAALGGGILLDGASPTLTGNAIAGNTADYDGGGIYCYMKSRPFIAGNTIAGNTTAWRGGAICCDVLSAAVMFNNIVCANGALMCGGAFYVAGSAAVIANDTVVNNASATAGGGIGVDYSQLAWPSIANTISWDNAAPAGPEIFLDQANLAIAHSDVEGGLASCYVTSGSVMDWGPGMIDADPLFCDPAEGDLHLTVQSPCHNAGDDAAAIAPYDFEGDPRFAAGATDMGADELYFHLCNTGVVVYLTLPPLWVGLIGTVPAGGILTFPVTVPNFWSAGREKPFQALVGNPGGTWTRLTNLETLVVE